MRAGSYRTICQFCHTNCGVIVHRTAAGIDSVKGDSNHPMNKGRCCSKAAAIPEIVKSKDRLRFPLRRASNGFERITWDEALKFAAEKLGEIRAKFGPASLVRCMGAPVSYQGRDGFRQFMGAFGSPNLTGTASVCMVPRMTAFRAVTGNVRAEADFEKAALVIFWGADPLVSERFGAYSAYNGMRNIIPRLKERGVRIIAIDPARSPTVRQADHWVQLNPGTDAALVLAMINQIISEELYDNEFVAQYTSGFEQLAVHVQTNTPKWAEGITGISEETIVDLARLYATTKPAAICDGNGFDMYVNGVDAVRTVAILIGLTGNLDVPGGNVFLPFVSQSVLPTKAPPIEGRIWHEKFPIFPEIPFAVIKEEILREEANHPHAMIVHHGNPVLVNANEARTRQAMRKLQFVMVSDIFPTATTEMADLILPITSDFESYGYRAYSSLDGGFLALGRPVANPPGEARPVFEVEYELAQQMGLQNDYPFHDTLGWLEYMLEPSGISFKQLEEKQIVYGASETQYRKHVKNGFATPSGKVEFYSQLFETHGYSPLPSYSEPAGESLDPSIRSEKGFPLLGTSKRPSQYVHTKFRNIKALNKAYPEPLIYLHPQDAVQRGIKESDTVEVTSPHGRITLKATLSEDAKAGLVRIDFGWGNPTDGKANINVLTNDEFFDPVSGGTPNRLFACDVTKKQEQYKQAKNMGYRAEREES
jgi:anaerobic selenocysteine-containing dehydrogenase